MTENQEKKLHYASLGRLLSEMQHTVRMGGILLCDRDLCKQVGISTRTYAKVKEASAQTSPSI